MDIAGEARTERRLAAILAADVVGYSRLMGKDEEGTLFALKAVRRDVTDPRIDEHRGRIVKTTGDGLLVEFASVVDAVRCAVDIQRAMQRRYEIEPIEDPLRFRIGINLGDIIIDEADIFGDGVNVAARLEGLADPGGICVSRIVRDQVRDKLSCGFEDLGQRQVKNIARPVHVFRIPLDARGPAAAGAHNQTAATRSRRGRHLAAAIGGAAAVVAAGALVSQMLPVTGAAPASPVVEAAVFFDKDKVALSAAADASIRQEADSLRRNPGVTMTLRAYCSAGEGEREGPKVLAELRANQIRDALKQAGVAGGRIKVENACRPGSPNAAGGAETSGQQNRRVVLIRN
jgi:class 3 adenylate cyclase